MATTAPATPTPAAAAPAARALPDGIEIFRAGRHVDAAGRVYVFTEADIDAMVAAYDPALREAPLTVGHPQDDRPAYGWVKGLKKLASGTLAMTPHQVEPQFAQMVAEGRFKKRSASFYTPAAPYNPTPGKWYLRHVAFLGAQPPAVAGLKDIAFSAGDAGGVVSFTEPLAAHTVEPAPQQEHTPMNEELKDELARAKKELAAAQQAAAKASADAAAAEKKAADAQALAASFAERERATRKAGFVAFAQAQVRAGRLLPKDEAMAVATLEALADAKPVEFSEGDATRKLAPAQWLQELIAAAKPVVSFGEFAAAAAPAAGAGAARGKSDAEIDEAARAYARAHKVNYAEALTAVTASFGA